MRTLQDWSLKSNENNDPEPLVLKHIESEQYPPSGGVVVWNPRGKTLLRSVQVHTQEIWNNQELIDEFILLGNVPLVYWQRTGCGTCQKLLQSGFENAVVVAHYLQLIQLTSINSHSGHVSGWLDPLVPIIELMAPGIYLITLDHYYPTDGHGHFFWDAYSHLRVWRGLSDNYWLEDDELINTPSFLAPSQPASRFSMERFEKVRDRYREYPGIAWYMGHQAAVLLDGHHRATAAAQAQSTFPCLTISSLSCQTLRRSNQIEVFGGAKGFRLKLRVPPSLSSLMSEWERSSTDSRSAPKGNQSPEGSLNWRKNMLDMMASDCVPYTLPEELGLQEKVKAFPTPYKTPYYK